MDLISREAAIEEFEDMVTSVSVYMESAEARYATNARIRFLEKLNSIPSVPAVPLDKLCEWLAAWDIQVIPCNVCKSVFHLESCPHGPFDCGDSEHLKMLIKKWMEGLDGTD